MVFCTYCGQSFKRKEHLERHLPHHTNVKPFKCDSCQLSFARRDLLQKHHSTYHEVQVNQQGTNGDYLASQRTPIACSNCATAKAGCDKKVPCSRCLDKSLTCAPRFARRSSKGIVRSTAPSLPTVVEHPPPLPYQNFQTSSSLDSCINPHMTGELSMKGSYNDSNLLSWESSQGSQSNSSQFLETFPRDFNSPGDVLGVSSDLLGGSGDFDSNTCGMDNMNLWDNYSMDLDVCGDTNLGDLTNNAIFWLPDTSGLAQANGMPSPPSTTSTSRSRINSNSPAWQPHRNPLSQEAKVKVAMLDPNSTEIPELELVIATHEAWPMARCNPRIFSGCCPRTAVAHLQTLQHCSKLEDAWKSMNNMTIPDDQSCGDSSFCIFPLQSTTRDKIIAFAQSFLLKALIIHQGGLTRQSGAYSPGAGIFFSLPPSHILENLLGNSLTALRPYSSLFHGTTLDTNELLLNDDASTLLFLLMIAHGASTVPKAEARYLAAGLTETCRISLFDLIEKNIEFSADPIVLKAAFLFILVAAWGGDSWHIKQAMGQRGMYLAMLKHSGLLEPQVSPSSNFTQSPDMNWKEWLRREQIYRLVYNWAMVDYELSLFHDTSPILSIGDLQTPLPCNDSLWRSKSSEEWLKMMQETYPRSSNMEFHSHIYPTEDLSLSHLFQDLLRDETETKPRKLSALYLKLLLHPLQNLVYPLGQLLSCFYGIHDNQLGTPSHTTASTLLQLEEVQSLLHKWYDLAMHNHRIDSDCPVTNSSLVLYHLVYLNTVTYFPGVERVVRREDSNGHSWESELQSKKFIYHSDKAVFHALRVFMLISKWPKSGRAPWWSAALYRAAMILWVDRISRSYRRDGYDNEKVELLNSDTCNDLAIKEYLSESSCTLYTGTRGGDCAKPGLPEEILLHCVSLLEDGVSSRFSDGIKRKLQTVLKIWKAV